MFVPASLLIFAVFASVANAYWLMGLGFIITERLDPIVSPGKISAHVHSVAGGSNFGFNITTALLRKSTCTSSSIAEDKSNYWFPQMYFHWKNESFTALTGGTVIYYLFSDTPGKTTAFPDGFRMLSGDPTLRTYNASSHAQQAVTFLCLDFNGVSTRHNELPSNVCPDGIRAQINLPSCWDGKNVDSPDHKSHVAFLSNGPDSGECKDPQYSVTLPRIFMEVYWDTQPFNAVRSSGMNSSQPFVFSHGDATGYGYHADFFNGWDAGVLQRAVDNCHCNPYGDPTCCAQAGIFDFNPKGNQCYISPQVDEAVTGTLPKLPGNNPVQGPQDAVNGHVILPPDNSPPDALFPQSAWTTTPDQGACAVGNIGAKCHRGPAPGASGMPPSSLSSHAATSTTGATSVPKVASTHAPSGTSSTHLTTASTPLGAHSDPATSTQSPGLPPALKSPSPATPSGGSGSNLGPGYSGSAGAEHGHSGSGNAGSDGYGDTGTCGAVRRHAHKRRRSIH